MQILFKERELRVSGRISAIREAYTAKKPSIPTISVITFLGNTKKNLN